MIVPPRYAQLEQKKEPSNTNVANLVLPISSSKLAELDTGIAFFNTFF